MKVINVTPGLISIPPNGWGAVEKIIWENHCNFKKLGVDSSIKYLDDVDSSDDIVMIHVANLANIAHDRGIQYYFMMHDHHAYLYGKDSPVYKENLKAIKGAKKAFVPAKFLIEYFEGVPEYFSHGVNVDFFKPAPDKVSEKHRLLCVANNGYASDPTVDRKGFGLAIKMAQHFDLPLTIVGPKNNKHYFDKCPPSYKKLSIIYDLNEAQLLETYQDHSIFIHMSELEAGHPNMTLLEAMSCGLPIVGTLENGGTLSGMKIVQRDEESGISGLLEVIEKYETYKTNAIETAKSLSWEKRSAKMLRLYNSEIGGLIGFRNNLNLALQNIKINSSQSNGTTFSSAKTAGLVNHKNNIKINYDFHYGCRVELLADSDRSFEVSFEDKDSNSVLYKAALKSNHWAKCAKAHYVNYRVTVKEGDKVLFQESLNLKDKEVFVEFDSSSLGDTLAWVPYVEEFRLKHSCKIYCSTFFNELFKGSYKDINFIAPNTPSEVNFYAKYKLGYFSEDTYARVKNPTELPLQAVACDILGIDFKEIKPILSLGKSKPKSRKPYVCIATQSTSQAKYWNNPKGWATVINYLTSKGYEVWCIDKYPCFGSGKNMNTIPKGAIDKTGSLPLEERIEQIKGSEFFIGLSSGLSWLAWALDKPVILISGFTAEFNEFDTPYRVLNKKVCNSCWNDASCRFDAGDWLWCPRGKNFECSSQITSEMVIEKVKLLLYV